MAVDVAKLANDMLAAALPALKHGAGSATSYAGHEMKKLAETVAYVDGQLLLGTITDTEAKLLLEMQEHAARSVLTAVQGIGLIAAQDAINAALDVAKGVVGAALKALL